MTKLLCLSLLFAQSPHKAWKAYYEGNYTQAQNIFLKLTSQKHKAPHGLIGLAYLELSLDNLPTAQKYTDSVQRILPSPLRSPLKEEWVLLRAQWAIKKDKVSLADSLLGLLNAEKAPFYTEVLLLRATNCLKQKLLTPAESLLALATLYLQKNPNPFQLVRCTYLMAQVEQSRNNRFRAESLYQQGSLIAHTALHTYPVTYATSLTNAATFWLTLGKYALAESLFSKALTHLKPAVGETHPQSLAATFSLASAYLQTQKFSRAESLFKKLLSYPLNPMNQLKTYLNLALLYQTLGNYPIAESLYHKVLLLHKEISPTYTPIYANACNNLGNIYSITGRYTLADSFLKKAMEVYTTLQGHGSMPVIRARHNLAILYNNLGKSPLAESLHKENLSLVRTLVGENHPIYSTVCNELASVYYDLGQYALAESLYKKARALRIVTLGPNHLETLISTNSLANTYYEMENLRAAESLYTEVLRLLPLNLKTSHPLYAVASSNLGIIFYEQRKFSLAESLYKEALRARLKLYSPPHPEHATSFLNLANLYVATGKYALAESLYKKAIAYGKAVYPPSHPDLLMPQLRLAHLYLLQNKPDSSWRYQQNASALFDSLTYTYLLFMTHAERERFLAKHEKYLLAYPLMAWQAGAPTLSRWLYDRILARKGILYRLSRDLRQALTPNLRHLYQEISMLYLLAEENYSQPSVYDSLSKIAAQKERELARKAYLSGITFHENPITWQEIQKSLKSHEAAVEILRVQKLNYATHTYSDTVGYLALILRSTGEPIFTIRWDGKAIEKHYISKYIQGQNRLFGYEQAHTVLWEWIEKHLAGVKKVYFSPDGAFNRLNPASIYNPLKKAFVSDYMEVELTHTTGNILKRKPLTLAQQDSIYLFAPFASEQLALAVHRDFWGELTPLPATQKEIEAITTQAQKKGYTAYAYVGGGASEERLKSLRQPRVLHLATHGYYTEEITGVQNAWKRVGILLAEAQNPQKEDGILTAQEASLLDLRETKLVTLSACQTGLGEITSGQGVYGMAWALGVAGARAFILTLWPVNDQTTQEFMQSFYEKLLSGIEIQKAFRQTQSLMRKKYKAPCFWAPFVLLQK
ncbi:MAG: tetratricopeptide repeat protein [Bacteroidia bacterium]